MGLQQRAGDWQDRVFKAIIFFAVLGCIVLGIGAYMLNHIMADVLTPGAPAPANSTTKPDQSH